MSSNRNSGGMCLKRNSSDNQLYTIECEDIKHAKTCGLIFSVQIGVGTFSDVFKGTFNGQTVAIKRVHHNRCRHKETYEQEKDVSILLKVSYIFCCQTSRFDRDCLHFDICPDTSFELKLYIRESPVLSLSVKLFEALKR